MVTASAAPLAKAEESSLYRQPMSDGQWWNNVTVLKRRMENLDHSLLREAAEGIRNAYDCLEPVMERYCEVTCPTCGDVCCQATGVFFNLTDLLAILALGLDPPPGQTRRCPRTLSLPDAGGVFSAAHHSALRMRVVPL